MLPCGSCHCFAQYPLRTASAPPPAEAAFPYFCVMNGSTSEGCCSETKPKDHYSAVTSSKLFSLCSHYLLTKPNLLRKASCVNLCVMTLGKEGWIAALPQALCTGSSAPAGTLLGTGPVRDVSNCDFLHLYPGRVSRNNQSSNGLFFPHCTLFP